MIENPAVGLALTCADFEPSLLVTVDPPAFQFQPTIVVPLSFYELK